MTVTPSAGLQDCRLIMSIPNISLRDQIIKIGKKSDLANFFLDLV